LPVSRLVDAAGPFGRQPEPPTGRQPPGCSSARPRLRPTCCTSTPSSTSATAPPPSPRRSTAACSPPGRRNGR